MTGLTELMVSDAEFWGDVQEEPYREGLPGTEPWVKLTHVPSGVCAVGPGREWAARGLLDHLSAHLRDNLPAGARVVGMVGADTTAKAVQATDELLSAVVVPAEGTLVVRVSAAAWTAQQVRWYQDYLDNELARRNAPFMAVVVMGDELALGEPPAYEGLGAFVGDPAMTAGGRRAGKAWALASATLLDAWNGGRDHGPNCQMVGARPVDDLLDLLEAVADFQLPDHAVARREPAALVLANGARVEVVSTAKP